MGAVGQEGILSQAHRTRPSLAVGRSPGLQCAVSSALGLWGAELALAPDPALLPVAFSPSAVTSALHLFHVAK